MSTRSGITVTYREFIIELRYMLPLIASRKFSKYRLVGGAKKLRTESLRGLKDTTTSKYKGVITRSAATVT